MLKSKQTHATCKTDLNWNSRDENYNVWDL